MRVIHVATLVSPDGAFGGPIRVAVNQVRELRSRGYDAVLAAGFFGEGIAPDEVDGVPVKLFPVRRLLPKTGFAGFNSPQLHRWLRENVLSADAVHIHLARDLVTLPAAWIARRAGVPFVVQPHGMIDPSSNPLSIPLDRAMTKPLLRSASSVFFLTDQERRGLVSVAGSSLTFEPLVNGVPSVAETGDSSQRSELDVLFLARLHPRKRPDYFIRSAINLIPRFPGVRFSVVGPDEGSLDGISRLIRAADPLTSSQIAVEGPLPMEATLRRVASSDIYVLPSVDEPFPMSVLEAMSLGKPVIVTESCGLAPYVKTHRAGLVISSAQNELTEAIAALISDADLRAQLSANARRLARDVFSMTAVGDQLTATYARSRLGRTP